MPIWKTPGVNVQPSLAIIRWRVLEITEGEGKGSRHIVGYCVNNYEGRVSTL